MPDDTIVADVLLSSSEDGDVRVNIGENSDGLGFGADTAVYANGDGFISVPNGAGGGGAAQVVVMQDGNVRRVIASRDNRYAGAAGALAPGDRAVVSDSEAWIKLMRATDTIEIRSGDMVVKIDGDTGTVTIDGVGTIRIGENATLVHLGSGSEAVVVGTETGRVVRYGDLVQIPVVGAVATGTISAPGVPPATVPVAKVKA